MAKDLTKIVNSLRDAAVGRCKERIEQAAQKTKCVFNPQKPVAPDEKISSGTNTCGVTALLKRRHGL
jgi:hypothetical protein